MPNIASNLVISAEGNMLEMQTIHKPVPNNLVFWYELSLTLFSTSSHPAFFIMLKLMLVVIPHIGGIGGTNVCVHGVF